MAASPYQLVSTDISGSKGLFNIGNKTSGAKSLLLSSLDDGTSVVFESNGQTRAKIEVADEDTSLVFRIGTSLSEVFRVTENGRVGINTNSPTELLQVNGNIALGGGATRSLINLSNYPLIFGTNSVERVRITADGLVGINTNSPTESLQVNGNIALGGGATRSLINLSNYPLVLGTNSTERVRITSNGRVGINVSDPDGLLEVSEAGSATNVFPLYVSNTGAGANTRASIRFDIANVYYGSIGGGIEGDNSSSVSIDAPSSTSSLIFTKNNRVSELGRFNSDGNFGIGVNNPLLKLSVNGDVWVGDGSGNEVGRFVSTSGNLYLRSVSSLLLGANGVEKARIDTDGKLLVGKNSSTGSALFQLAGDASFEGIGYIKLPSGTTGERPVFAIDGMIRYNSSLTQFEGYKNSTWGTIGGAGATGGGTDEVFLENGNTVTTSYTVSAGKNAVSAGPITINSGAVVTVPSGASWAIV